MKSVCFGFYYRLYGGDRADHQLQPVRDQEQAQEAERKIKKTAGRIGTLNLILILVGAFFVWFNWQMLEIFRQYASIPETYACAVIAATIGECGICGWIRTNKDRRREHQWEQEEKQAGRSAKLKESEETANE